MRKSYRRIIEWVVVLVILLSCGGILWWPYKDAEVKPWEQGKDVPESPPAEDRRVYNPHHFSIVAPPRWRCDITPPEADANDPYPTMLLRPKTTFARRCASIYIETLDKVPSVLAEYRKTEFQGQPACFKIETGPGTFDDPPGFHYSLYFERSSRWYHMGYVGLLHQEELPPMVQQYLDTFRVEESPQQKDGL